MKKLRCINVFVLLMGIGPSYLAILVAELTGKVVWKKFICLKIQLRFKCIYLFPNHTRHKTEPIGNLIKGFCSLNFRN